MVMLEAVRQLYVADLVEAVPVSQVATVDEELLHEVPMPRTATLYLNTHDGARLLCFLRPVRR